MKKYIKYVFTVFKANGLKSGKSGKSCFVKILSITYYSVFLGLPDENVG